MPKPHGSQQVGNEVTNSHTVAAQSAARVTSSPLSALSAKATPILGIDSKATTTPSDVVMAAPHTW